MSRVALKSIWTMANAGCRFFSKSVASAFSSVIQLPITLIELILIGPTIMASSLMISTVDDKSFCRTYMDMWRSVVTGGEGPISVVKMSGLAVLAFLTSPIGLWSHMLVTIILLISMSGA